VDNASNPVSHHNRYGSFGLNSKGTGGHQARDCAVRSCTAHAIFASEFCDLPGALRQVTALAQSDAFANAVMPARDSTGQHPELLQDCKISEPHLRILIEDHAKIRNTGQACAKELAGPSATDDQTRSAK
jgi:hypothetical protein